MTGAEVASLAALAADAEDRRLIREALDDTLVVEAAAGTGKTTELVSRIVQLIVRGRATIEQIVAVTFSEKAAGELKLRLREELERARVEGVAGSVDTERLEKAVQRFEEAHVNTIHGFCADLLRERPVEARLDPSFQVLTDGQAAQLFDEAFSDWLQGALDHPGEGLRRSLRRDTTRRFGQEEDEAGPLERLKRAGADLLDWRDHQAPWTRPSGFDRDAQIDHLLDAIAAFTELSKSPANRFDLFFRKTKPIRRVHAEVHQIRSRGMADYDGWEARLCALAGMTRELSEGREKRGHYSQKVPRQAVVEARDLLVSALAEFRERADADLAARVHAELQDAIAQYGVRKLRAGGVDFLDLLIRARDLVRDHPRVRREFQHRFRYLLVDEFQDTDPLQAELLLLLAAEESHTADDRGATGDAERETARGHAAPGTPDAAPSTPHGALGTEHSAFGIRPGALFIVGDPKQSVYRFRRADVRVYRDTCERLIQAGARRVRLRTSFRSVPAIQRAVNAAFSHHMTGDAATLQAPYVELHPHRSEHPTQPAVIALPVTAPYGFQGVTAAAIARCLPSSVAEFVRWLVQDSAWTVAAEDGQMRPVRAGDVCLLFRRFLDYQQDVTRPYIEALESRGVRHLLVGGKAFHEREEVDALRTALTAIEWPDDALSVFATLRGPFFAVGEEELLAWHELGCGFRPYQVPDAVPDALASVAEALGALRELNRLRNHRPIADTISQLMTVTRAHAAFVLWNSGEQVLANVLQIAELARQYEAEGGLSFRGFVDRLREAAARAPTPEAPVLEEGTDGVRLMTVHKAKGLEFPVVILADIGCRLHRDEAQRYLDSARGLAAIRLAGWTPLDLREHNALESARDQAEGVRLAYVAATRARDLLVVPAVGDGPHEKGWVHPLSPAIYPAARETAGGQTDASASDHVAGRRFTFPPFKGRDTVLERPQGHSAGAGTLRPGVYQFTDPITGAPYDVVWWDPLLLDRPGEDRRGLRREDLIAKAARPELVAQDRSQYEEWKAGSRAAIAAGEQPSLRVVTASEWARFPHPLARELPPVATENARPSRPRVVESTFSLPFGDEPQLPESRPSGRRFGILVHALLAAVRLGGTREEIAEMAAVHARLLAAPDEERHEAVEVVHRALSHPLLARARAADAAGRDCRREVALSLVLGDVVIDGQADLVWDDGQGWVVVDFKSDVELGEAEDAYRRQVALYAEAVMRATGQPARGVLLRI